MLFFTLSHNFLTPHAILQSRQMCRGDLILTRHKYESMFPGSNEVVITKEANIPYFAALTKRDGHWLIVKMSGQDTYSKRGQENGAMIRASRSETLPASITGGDVVTQGFYTYYSRQGAVNYANRWWNGRNPKYRSFSNDCANFVSQSFYEGALLGKLGRNRMFGGTIPKGLREPGMMHGLTAGLWLTIKRIIFPAITRRMSTVARTLRRQLICNWVTAYIMILTVTASWITAPLSLRSRTVSRMSTIIPMIRITVIGIWEPRRQGSSM